MKITIEREKLSWGDFFMSQSGSLYYITLLYADTEEIVSKKTCAIVRFNTGEVIRYVDMYEIDTYLDEFEEEHGEIRKVVPQEIIFK